MNYFIQYIKERMRGEEINLILKFLILLHKFRKSYTRMDSQRFRSQAIRKLTEIREQLPALRVRRLHLLKLLELLDMLWK